MKLAVLVRKIDWRLILIAAAITVAQIIFATICARGESWRDHYLSLWTWDGGWYADILENGYHSTDPIVTGSHASNVAFFPAYPLLARGIWKLSGWSPGVSLLVSAQLAAFAFWWCLLRQLRDWKIASTISATAVMVTFCHPAAFYLVVTYADSLFMASFLGLLVLGGRASSSLAVALGAGMVGFICSATRIVGAPLAALPVVWAWNDLWPAVKSRVALASISLRLSRYIFISLATAFGALGFFWYCAVRFGHWDLYMRTRAAGWQVFKSDYWAILSPRNFQISMPRFHQGFIAPVDVSHLYVAIMIIAVILLPLLDYIFCWVRSVNTFSRRVPFYLAASLLFFFSASGGGLADGHYLGFLRYGFYSHLPLLLAVVHAQRDWWPEQKEISFAWQIVIFLLCALGLALQAHFCYLYSHEVMVS